MNVHINGESRALDDGATVAQAVSLVSPQSAGRGVAVALNGEVVPRSRWDEVALSEADRIEVLRAVGGG